MSIHRISQLCVSPLLCLAFAANAQQTSSVPVPAVPKLVRFAGSFHPPANQNPGPLGATFAIYSQQEGGGPVWSEDQNVDIDSNGNYSVLLGSTKNEGVPLELFSSGEDRWLQVNFHVPGEVILPRVLLVSVPYALKASDADTLGGRPASAYALTNPSTFVVPLGPAGASQSDQLVPRTSAGNAIPLTSSGTPGYIAKFTNTTDVINSVVYQNNSSIGINTTTPLDTLHVEGSITAELDGGPTSGPALDLRNTPATGFGIGSVNFYTYPNQTVPSAQWQAKDIGGFAADQTLYTAGTLGQRNQPLVARLTVKGGTGNVGIGTTTPTASLEVNGTAKFDGIATFAGGQTFPDTLTGVTAGGGLQVSGSTVGLTTSCANGQVLNWTGTVWQCANVSGGGGGTITGVTAGTDLLGGGTAGNVTLSLDTNKIPQLGSPNTFSATQSIGSGDLSINNGNVNLPQTTSSGAGVIYMGSSPFIHACCALGGNTFLGSNAGSVSSGNTGGQNVGIGSSALNQNTTGQTNTAVGTNAMLVNTSGSYNTALGWDALISNGNASNNTAVGANALNNNTSGADNTAAGRQSLAQNSSGTSNTAIGFLALNGTTTGNNNTAIGYAAGENITTTSNNIDINNNGVTGDNGVIRIGTAGGAQTAAFIAGIYGVNIGSSVQVLINSNGQIGTVSSSRRYKEDIRDMSDASSGLLRLRPVTFRYKKPYEDGSKPIQYGLIAEEVAEVYPDLVARSTDGQIETVKYQLLGPMILNELQKQNATIAVQKEQIREQGKQIQSLQERLAKVEAVLQGANTTAVR